QRQRHNANNRLLSSRPRFAMSKKAKCNMSHTRLDGSITSEETVESVEPSGSQHQESQREGTGINPQMKEYVDAMIQATAASITQS
ncbi:51_t:CDS:1, partial [Racocetra persica]